MSIDRTLTGLELEVAIFTEAQALRRPVISSGYVLPYSAPVKSTASIVTSTKSASTESIVTPAVTRESELEKNALEEAINNAMKGSA